MASTFSISLEVKAPLLPITKSQLQFIYSRKSEIRWSFSISADIQSGPECAESKVTFWQLERHLIVSCNVWKISSKTWNRTSILHLPGVKFVFIFWSGSIDT